MTDNVLPRKWPRVTHVRDALATVRDAIDRVVPTLDAEREPGETGEALMVLGPALTQLGMTMVEWGRNLDDLPPRGYHKTTGRFVNPDRGE